MSLQKQMNSLFSKIKDTPKKCKKCVLNTRGDRKAPGIAFSDYIILAGYPYENKAAKKLFDIFNDNNINYTVIYAQECAFKNQLVLNKKEIKSCFKENKKQLNDLIKANKVKLLVILDSLAAELFFGVRESKKAINNFVLIEEAVVFTFKDLFQTKATDTSFIGALQRISGFLKGMLFEDKQYTIIDLNNYKTELPRMKKIIKKLGYVAVDIETGNVDFKKRLVKPLAIKTIAFCVDNDWAWSVLFQTNKTDNVTYLHAVEDVIVDILKDPAIVKIFHNAKFEIKEFTKRGWEVNNFRDTMIEAFLLYGKTIDSISLKYLSQKFLKFSYDMLIKDFDKANLLLLASYNMEDVNATFQLHKLFRTQIKGGLKWVYDNIMLPGVLSLVHIELAGVKFDLTYARKLHDELTEKNKQILNRLYELYPEAKGININSSDQIGNFLENVLHIVPKERTESGKFATGKHILKEYAEEGLEFTKLLLNYRKYEKELTTYVDALPNNLGEDGRINSTYSITGTATGRLSSSNPNLQNIPRDKAIKKLFIADEGAFIVNADFSQAELRVIASLANEENMIKVYREDGDIHKLTASAIANVDISEVTKQQRQQAKAVNFGLIYGMSPAGLQIYAKQSYGVEMTREEAEQAVLSYFSKYYSIKAWHQQTIQQARIEKCIRTPFGRIRHLPNITSNNSKLRANDERKALNTPVQSAAADLTLITINRIKDYIEKHNFKTKIVMTVHDSIVMVMFPNEALDIIKFALDTIAGYEHEFHWLKCPMKMDFEYGPNYGELIEYKPDEFREFLDHF